MLRDTGKSQDALQVLDAAERFDAVNPACTEIRFSVLEQAGQGLFMPTSAAPTVFHTGPAQMPIEIDGDYLLDTLDPFRDRAKGPKHIRVRVSRVADQHEPTVITVPPERQAKERQP